MAEGERRPLLSGQDDGKDDVPNANSYVPYTQSGNGQLRCTQNELNEPTLGLNLVMQISKYNDRSDSDN